MWSLIHGVVQVPSKRSCRRMELEIARLAAEGRSNREIGQPLVLSHRTVGSRLNRIFRKLGITSRGYLVASLSHDHLRGRRRHLTGPGLV